MTSRELKKLSRAELLEMLIEQSKEVAALKEQLDDAVKRLDDRTIIMSKVGSIAEASLQLNGVFEAAQNAAAQYLENVRQQAEKLLSDTKKRCRTMEEETQKKCEDMIKMCEAGQGQTGTEPPENQQG